MNDNFDKFDQRVRDYYSAQALRPEVRSRLRARVGVQPPPAPARPAGIGMRRLAQIGTACSLVAAVGIVILLAALLRPKAPPSGESATTLTAREAVATHHSKLAMEFATSDVAQLSAQMSKLGFTLVMPERFKDGKRRLVGARYCMLQGQIAAQLSFEDAKGRICTVFEVRSVDQLALAQDGRHTCDGCPVEMWRESGLLLVMAG